VQPESPETVTETETQSKPKPKENVHHRYKQESIPKPSN